MGDSSGCVVDSKVLWEMAVSVRVTAVGVWAIAVGCGRHLWGCVGSSNGCVENTNGAVGWEHNGCVGDSSV